MRRNIMILSLLYLQHLPLPYLAHRVAVVVALRSRSRVFTLFSYFFFYIYPHTLFPVFRCVSHRVALFSFFCFSSASRIALRLFVCYSVHQSFPCCFLVVLLCYIPSTRVSHVGFWLFFVFVHGWVVHLCFSLSPMF